MRIRFEVAARKTWGFPYFVARAKKYGTHRIKKTGGLDTHVVEVKTTEQANAVWNYIRSWVAVAVFVDGKEMDRSEFARAMLQHRMSIGRTKQMLDDVLKRAQSRRGDDDGRWRMGLGPDPRLGF